MLNVQHDETLLFWQYREQYDTVCGRQVIKNESWSYSAPIASILFLKSGMFRSLIYNI